MSGIFSLDGKVAFVTGGSRGIGAMIARGLLDHGAKVYIASRKGEACDKAAETLSQYGPCISLPGDIARMSEIERLAAELASREKRLDILVNNAGASWGAPVESFPEEGWDRVVNLNMKSVFFLIQRLLPLMADGPKQTDPARVVNIGSIDGLHVSPMFNAISYGASKAGLLFMTRILATNLAKRNITVNALAPGFFNTDMLSAAVDPTDERVLNLIPLRRVGEGEDIAGVVVMLCARAGALMTGTIIPVDGGIIGAA